MFDIIRDATLGQALNALFGIFPYEDQRSDYEIPARLLVSSPNPSPDPNVVDEKLKKRNNATTGVRPVSDSTVTTLTPPEVSRRPSNETYVATQLYPRRDEQNDHVEDGLKTKAEEHYNLDVTPGADQLPPHVSHPEYTIIGWNGDDDQDNPRNWSLMKRSFVAAQIMLLTFAVCEHTCPLLLLVIEADSRHLHQMLEVPFTLRLFRG